MQKLAAFLLLCGATCVLAADEKPDIAAEVAKHKALLEAAKKTIDAPKAAIIETKNLIVFSTLPADKLKSIGDGLERQFATAVSALKFDDTDKNWTGKLGVYVFADRDEYGTFMSKVEKRSVERDEAVFVKGSGDNIYVAVTIGRGKINPDLEREAQLQLANALLSRKTGTAVKLPIWVTDGFGRAVLFRAVPLKYAGERGRMRSVASKKPMKEVWSDEPNDDTYLVSTSFMDYLAFGPEKAKFVDFLKGMAPAEGKKGPDVNDAFEAAKIDGKKIEAAWHKWASSGK